MRVKEFSVCKCSIYRKNVLAKIGISVPIVNYISCIYIYFNFTIMFYSLFNYFI